MRTGIVTMMVVALTAAHTSAQQPGQQSAPSPAPSTLASAQALRCTFTLFVATRWVDGEPETVAGDDQFAFSIEAIDLPARRALIVGATASATASAFVTDTGLNVIEQTPIGNFILTTIFANGRIGDRFMAVHSRHLGDLSAPPGPSQYFGSCEAVQ